MDVHTVGDVKSDALSSLIEMDAFKALFPLRFYERHLAESIRPDGRQLEEARLTTIALGAVDTADGSALIKIGYTTMLAAIKMEIMKPVSETPDEGRIAVQFHMAPICSPLVRPGRPAEVAPVISKQLFDVIHNSSMINLKDLCVSSGKAAWMVYLDIYCLDADGSLFDAALLAAVSAFLHLQIPVVSLQDDGKVILLPEKTDMDKKLSVARQKRKLCINNIPFSLSSILHNGYILADPNAEEESIMETLVTIVLDQAKNLVSLYKPGGPVLASQSALQDCITLTSKRMKELQKLLDEALCEMDVDQSTD